MPKKLSCSLVSPLRCDPKSANKVITTSGKRYFHHVSTQLSAAGQTAHEFETCGTACAEGWSGWGACTTEGKSTRIWEHTSAPSGGGSVCKTAALTTETATCSFNCMGAWGDWGPCHDGWKTATYSITAPNKAGGATCDNHRATTKSTKCSTAEFTALSCKEHGGGKEIDKKFLGGSGR